MAKKLVIYYSRAGENYFPDGIRNTETGNTAIAADYIRAAVNADIFEIDTVKPYAKNYRECCAEAAAEARANARPEIQGYISDINMYDTIFVCYPCWCGTAPMCIFTFLEHYDLTGKKIVPLCSNEGSGMGNSEKDLKRSCPGAEVVPGLSVRGHQTAALQAEIAKWAAENV